MNIILFCRILSVDFSGVFRRKIESKTVTKQNTLVEGDKDRLRSFFHEEGIQAKRMT